MIKFSIVIPVYNAEQFISETIDSVLMQSYRNYELIIADDCSSDKTLDIIEKIADGDKRVKVLINETNQGVCETLRNLFHSSDGDYIIQLGHDDVICQDYLKNMEAHIQETSSKVIFGNVEYISEIPSHENEDIFNHELIEKLDSVDLAIRLLSGNFLCAPGSAFKRSLFNDSMFSIRNNRVHDYEMWVKLAFGHKFSWNKESIVKYRLHSANLSSPSIGVNTSKNDLFLVCLSVLNNSDLIGLATKNMSHSQIMSTLNNLKVLSHFSPPILPLLAQFIERVLLDIDNKDIQQILDEIYLEMGCVQKAQSKSYSNIPVYLDSNLPLWLIKLVDKIEFIDIQPELNRSVINEGIYIQPDNMVDSSYRNEGFGNLLDSSRIIKIPSKGYELCIENIEKNIRNAYESGISSRKRTVFTQDYDLPLVTPKVSGVKITLDFKIIAIDVSKMPNVTNVYDFNFNLIPFSLNGNFIIFEQPIDGAVTIEFCIPSIVESSYLEVGNRIFFPKGLILVNGKSFLELYQRTWSIPFFDGDDIYSIFDTVDKDRIKSNVVSNNQLKFLMKKTWGIIKPIIPHRLKFMIISTYIRYLK